LINAGNYADRFGVVVAPAARKTRAFWHTRVTKPRLAVLLL